MARNNVTMVRTARGLTVTELARRAGVHRVVMSKIEHGHQIPKLPLATKIAQALDSDLVVLWPDYVTAEVAPQRRGQG